MRSFTCRQTPSCIVIVCSHYMSLNTNFKLRWFKKYLELYSYIKFNFIIINKIDICPINLMAKSIMRHKLAWRGCCNLKLGCGGPGWYETQWDISSPRCSRSPIAWRTPHSMVRFERWPESGMWVSVGGKGFCRGWILGENWKWEGKKGFRQDK